MERLLLGGQAAHLELEDTEADVVENNVCFVLPVPAAVSCLVLSVFVGRCSTNIVVLRCSHLLECYAYCLLVGFFSRSPTRSAGAE